MVSGIIGAVVCLAILVVILIIQHGRKKDKGLQAERDAALAPPVPEVEPPKPELPIAAPVQLVPLDESAKPEDGGKDPEREITAEYAAIPDDAPVSTPVAEVPAEPAKPEPTPAPEPKPEPVPEVPADPTPAQPEPEGLPGWLVPACVVCAGLIAAGIGWIFLA